MWRTAQYDLAVNDSAGIDSAPAVHDMYIGSGFQQQTVSGVRHVDDTDDRVTYEATIMATSPQAFSIGLHADNDGVGYSSTEPGTVFGGISYGVEANTGPDDGRPRIGYPLDHRPDMEYANATNDVVGDTVLAQMPQLLPPNVRYVMEKPQQEVYRASLMPAEIQHTRPWDIVAGAWPWTGEKVALQRPSATAPLTFQTALHDPIPSPMGTSGADVGPNFIHMNVYTTPMTFRVPPEPWDVRNDGTYVDSGV